MNSDLTDLSLTSANELAMAGATTGYSGIMQRSPFVCRRLQCRACAGPAAVWLFGSGLVGLAGIARKRA